MYGKMINIVYGVIKKINDAKEDIKRFFAIGRVNEEFNNREFWQHYGFTSVPKEGANALILTQGNRIYMIASDDIRYRIQLQEGEVALYTDEGDNIVLKRGNIIEINAKNKVVVNASSEVDIKSGSINLGEGILSSLMKDSIIEKYNAHIHNGSGGTPSSNFLFEPGKDSTTNVKGS